MFEERFASCDERAVRERVERGPETHFVPCQFHELPHAHEAFSQSPFEHFGPGDVGGARFFALRVVDVFGDDAAVEDGGMEHHARQGFAELVASDEWPEDPVDG